MKQTEREALFDLLQNLSYEKRKVILASGRESDFYIDCRKVSLHPLGTVLCGRVMREHFAKLGVQAAGVGGPTLGADPLITSFAIAAYEAGTPMPSFIVRKEAKGHGTGKWIEGLSNLESDAPVVLLEDVVTTGGSTVRALEACRAEGICPVHVICLVDRQEGGREAIENAGVTFSSIFTRTHFERGTPE